MSWGISPHSFTAMKVRGAYYEKIGVPHEINGQSVQKRKA